ncbi:MAG: ATP-binding cassette domain-containing protein [Alphaproteobacteria bacterium]|nr:ATP-binding cassette domain-containing protein [Alphaproteobacteria bacterium]
MHTTSIPPLVNLQDIFLGFGSKTLFTKAELAIGKRERICLVGRNGAGKSTLLKVIAGLIEPESGERFIQPGSRIAYLPQEPVMPNDLTLVSYITEGLSAENEDNHYLVEEMLDTINLDGSLIVSTMSGGEKRRSAIGRALINKPDILLLDEPTNHLDLPTIEWLEATLESFAGGFVIISHDRTFLNRLTKTTLWVDRGIVRRLNKGFEHFDAWSEKILEQEEVERGKLDKLIAQETIWSRQGISARRKRNQGRLRKLYDLRSARAQQIERGSGVKLDSAIGNVSGALVIEAKHISKAFGDRIILHDFSTRIVRGDRIGIIGPNGAGKTTLLRLLTGDLLPDKGHIKLGANLTPVYLDQNRAQLDPEASLWATLCETGGDHIMVRGKPRHVVSYLRDFLFEEAQARSPIKSLSGGERNRLLLAKALAKFSNFLILDEPTNDLDMETLDLLQEMLAEYEGTLILVSHDRSFLDRVVTSTIVMEGDGHVQEYPGGYSDYISQCRVPENSPSQKALKSKKVNIPISEQMLPIKKLSYHQQRQLEQLPQKILDLETTIQELNRILADSTLFTQDPEAFLKAADCLKHNQKELEKCEDEWLELEGLREAIAKIKS